MEVIKRGEDYAYFFDSLESPAWIEPLQAEGFFKRPPPAEREGDWMRFPSWPEAQYLVRMASLAPERVLPVLLAMPETDNPRVRDDLVEAALAMPPELAARLVAQMITWLTERSGLPLLPINLAQLAAHLARGGLVDAAKNLTSALLAPLPPATDDEAADTGVRSRLDPQPRSEAWEYGEAIKALLPSVVRADPQGALQLFANLLESAISIRMRDRKPPSDNSFFWRPAIEDHAQNHSIKEVPDWLIEAVRDAAHEAVTGCDVPLRDVVELLESRPWRTFHRISLHVVRTNLQADVALAREKVLDLHRGEDVSQHHEYWSLVRDVFSQLDHADQEVLVNGILAGPAALDNEEPERHAKIWQLNRLAILRDVLGARWRPVYDGLVEELGFEPDHPLFLSYMTSWSGPRSPKARDDLLGMTVEDLIAFLRVWRPDDGDHLMGPSAEGLGRAVSAAVQSDPERYALAAAQFRGLDPTYVRSALQGWRDAAREDRQFPWQPVLDLCGWVVRQRDSGSAGSDDRDPGWAWSRSTVADLLGAGLTQSTCEIPFMFRAEVWSVLAPLTLDEDPTPRDEELYGGSNMDPPTLAINTTRGEALHTTVRYALWMLRHTPASEREAAKNFNAMPEVRQVLELHLKPDTEPSPAVRSTYGQWLPWLVLLDKPWVQAHLHEIFPEDPSLSHIRDAAWDAYVLFCRPYDEVFRIIRDEYRKALTRISARPSDGGAEIVAQHHLAEHLMLLVLRGELQIDDELIAALFSTPGDIRGHALAFVGRALREWDDVPSDVAERVRRLWVARQSVPQEQPGRHEELRAFGWWFISRELGDQWSFTNLLDVLRATKGDIDMDFGVIQRLAELAPEHPVAAVDAVRLIAESTQEKWGLAGSRDTVSTIIATALESQDASAQEAAEALIHSLGARGYREFRSLLSQERASG